MKTITITNLQIQFDTIDQGADKHNALTFLDSINEVLQERFSFASPIIFVNGIDDSQIAIEDQDEDKSIHTAMTKSKFKEQCSFHEYGKGQKKRNAIYFDWKSDYDNNAIGYKYMVKTSVENLKKNELFDLLFTWVTEGIDIPWYVDYKFAATEQNRFKVSLMG